MASETPTIIENLDSGLFQVLPDIARELKAGQITASAVNHLQVQEFIADVGTSAVTYTWEELGIARPRDADTGATAYGVTTGLIDAVGAITVVKTATGLTLNVATTAGRIFGRVYGSPYVENKAVTSNAATLFSSTTAPVPVELLDVVGLQASSTEGVGRLEIIRDADSNRQPGPGQVVWDGKTSLRFNSGDSISRVRATLIPESGGLSASALNAILGQRL